MYREWVLKQERIWKLRRSFVLFCFAGVDSFNLCHFIKDPFALSIKGESFEAFIRSGREIVFCNFR